MGSFCFCRSNFPGWRGAKQKSPAQPFTAHLVNGLQRTFQDPNGLVDHVITSKKAKYRMCMKHLLIVYSIYIYVYSTILYIYKHITYVVLIIYISYYTIYSYYTYKCMYVYNVYFKPKRALVLQLFGVQFGLFKSGLVNTPLLSNLLPQK